MLNKETLVALLTDCETQEIIKWGRASGTPVFDGHTLTHVERYGGREGSGEEHWVVFSVDKDGVKEFWKIPGWYQSYQGAELEIANMFRVQPERVEVIVWKDL